MTTIGYARVSTTDQDLSIQEAALKAAGCQVIRAEKRSGTTTEGREALRTVLEFLRAGDVLDGYPYRSPRPEHWRPSGHRACGPGARRGPEGHGAADRKQTAYFAARRN
jgi:hypothetical protein